MKGLLIKDLQLMKIQKRFFLVVMVMAVVLTFTNENPYFMIGYLTFLMPSFALSTISYDEFDNGNAFLFTLPISRQLYAAEKYVFLLLLELISLGVSFLLSAAVGRYRGGFSLTEALMVTAGTLALVSLFLSIMVPMQLRYGAEKGRVAMLLAAGGLIAVVFGGLKLLSSRGVDLEAVILDLLTDHLAATVAAAVAFVAAAVLISLAVSIRIMEKKEF